MAFSSLIENIKTHLNSTAGSGSLTSGVTIKPFYETVTQGYSNDSLKQNLKEATNPFYGVVAADEFVMSIERSHQMRKMSPKDYYQAQQNCAKGRADNLDKLVTDLKRAPGGSAL